ncbi:MAG: sigma-70 family RNA polymerase sigma factor [Acidimicrobiia bacterium]|nr:sigma-70 family RNA polymerase sigma factor [Acidimicrobiia bacterium]
MTISIDDRQLVESYQAGDDHAFADLVRVHTSSLMGHAVRRLHDRAAAEDAVQETFVRAFRALPRFDGDYRVGPWLHRILANVCVDEGNRRRREADKVDRFSSDPFAVELAPGVEDMLGLDIDDSGIADALATLPASYREALALRFIDDLPYDEVAKAAGVTEQNARARVSRARSAARTALRGVAAVPVFVFGALRRGERAAEAATAGHTTSGATDAASVAPASTVGHAASALAPAADAVMAAAPAAAPLMSKAAIGISMAVAVAVPTAGPAIVDRVTNPAPVVAAPSEGEGVVAGVGSTVEVDPARVGGAGGSSQGGTSATPPTGGTVAAPTVDPAATTPRAQAPVVVTPLPAPTPTPTAPSDVTEPVPPSVVVPAPVARTGGTLNGSDIGFTPAGPRLDLAGALQLSVGGAVHAGDLAGRLDLTAGSGSEAQRIAGNLTVTLADGQVVALRLNGFATPVAVDGDAESTAFTVTGQFRATSGEAIALLEGGRFEGAFDTASGNLQLTFTA